MLVRSLICDKLLNPFFASTDSSQVHDGFQPWGDPTNVRDPVQGINQGPQSFGSPHRGGVHVLMADGAVRFVSDQIAPKTFTALGTPAGNEVISEP